MFIYLCIYFFFGVNGLILWGRRTVGLRTGWQWNNHTTAWIRFLKRYTLFFNPDLSSWMAAIFQLVFTGIKCKCLHYISSGSQKFTVKLSNCNKLEIHAVSEMFGHAFPQINYSSSIGARDYIQESINSWYSLVLLQSLDRGHDWTIR